MKALVKTQKGDGFIEVLDVPEPDAASAHVKIKIHACGVCGTDIHIRHDKFPYWPPVILGHEFVGTIVELGKDCKYFKVGDRVVGEPHTLSCGHCYFCRTGNIQICEHKRSPGWGIDGGMAEYICYPEKLLHRIPENMTWKQGAMVESFANVVTHLLERTKVDVGDFVVIQGPGPIGLMAAMAARAAGARDVAIIGTSQDLSIRLKTARDLGFINIINIGESDPVRAVMDLTDNIGADVVVECSGSPKAIPITVDLVRKMGRVGVIGLTGGRSVSVPWDKFSFKLVHMIFNLSTSYTSWDKAIKMISSGAIEVEKLITHCVPLDKWEDAFNDMENLNGLKALLLPK